MVLHLRGRSARAARLAEPELREETRNAIELAEAHGIDRERDVQRFLEIVFDRWPEAGRDAEVLRILNSNSLAPKAKVAFVADALSKLGA
jgi:hypothetical protein